MLRHWTVLFLLLAALPASRGFAQESRGTILGRVTDASGAVIPNAGVRATNTATRAAASARSNEAGNYTIPYLLPGTYTLRVEAAGFKTMERPNIEVRVNDTLEVNAELTLGDVSERIEVTASTPLLETATSSLGQVMDGRRMTELPVQAGNPVELVMMAPGVTNATNLRLRKAGWNGAPSQMTTDGNSQYSNEFTIDGVSNTFASGTSPRIAFSPPQSAVVEMKVQTVSFDASLGHTPGSVVNATTRSGTNELHGELHEWFGNSALDLPNPFQNRVGQKVPTYQDNRYGASAGGPVYLPKAYDGRNKTFFFYAWEANKWGTPQTYVGTVPTNAQRGGDLSGLLALGSRYQIYDPLTTTAEAGGRFSRLPVPGNIIPASRLDPVARNIAKYWPQPNSAGTNEGRNNFTSNIKAGEDYYVHLLRLDHNFSERHRTFIRIDYDWWEENKSDYYENNTLGVILNRINRGVALDEVLVLSTSDILNIRYGMTQQEFPERRKSKGFDLSTLGFSSRLLSLVPDKSLTTFPYVSVSGYSPFGTWESGDGTNTSLIHSLVGNMTSLRGSHNMRYGAEYRLYRKSQVRYPYDISPYLTFGSTYTRGPLDSSTAAPLGQDFAAFLYGIPGGSMQRTASSAEQDQFLALYFQDDWKLTPRITLNIGLRYELETPLTERFDRSVKGFAYDAASPIEAAARANYAGATIPELPLDQFRVRGGLLFAGGSNGHSLWEGEKNNFLPRIGLTFSLNPKTVVRTGYGIFYDTNGVNRSAAIQTGFTQSTPIQATMDSGLTFVANTADPFPNGLTSPLGAAGGLSTFLGQGIAIYPAKRLQSYAQRWQFGIQRELPGGFVVDTAYVGNRGTRLGISRPLNNLPAKYLSTSPVRDQQTIDYLSRSIPNPFYGLNPIYGKNTSRNSLLRPYPQFGGITLYDESGYSWYHSLQVRAEKRFSHGYTFQMAYTWAKLMEAVSFLNDSDVMPSECIGALDRTHRLAVTGIYELPFGKGRHFASSAPAAVDFLIGGWQLNAVVQKQSGSPLGFGNVIFNGDLKDIPLSSSTRSLDRWINPNAGFERDSTKQLGSNIRTMPLRFSGIRGPDQSRWDISAIKYFPIGERVKMQFRAECFNALNHPNLDNPNTSVTSSAFGTITGVSPTQRSFQLALKLTF